MLNLKNRVSALADLTWYSLADLFEQKLKKRPPVYLFLSSESKGSLKKRNEEEIELVHDQQAKKGGVTLIGPPCAWVSKIEQVPEETAHLFGLIYQKKSPALMTTPEQELRMMIQHEALGRFATEVLFGTKPAPRRPKAPHRKTLSRFDLWNLGHREGYYLGHHLAKALYEEDLSAKELRTWFQMDWMERNQASLRRLYRISGQSSLFS